MVTVHDTLQKYCSVSNQLNITELYMFVFKGMTFSRRKVSNIKFTLTRNELNFYILLKRATFALFGSSDYNRLFNIVHL